MFEFQSEPFTSSKLHVLRKWRLWWDCADAHSRLHLILFVLKFYGPVNPMGSCRARSVYLTTRLLGSSGGTSVGNHNRSSVGIGCCCRCDFPIIIGFWIIRFGVHVSLLILVHGHMFTSSFNCTAQQLNSIFTKRLLVLFFSDLVA